jgi:hypothetical protein
MSSFDQKTKWWIGGVLSPFLFLGIGILVALGIPGHQDDWLGMRFIVPVMCGLLLGCLLSFAFTAVSLRKKEEGAFYALLVSIPALFVILYHVARIVSQK